MKHLTDTEFERLVAFVRQRCGINLEKKRTLIQSRLFMEIARQGYDGYGAYIQEVMRHPEGELSQHMINKLSTNYTAFFREPESLAYLTGHVLPRYERGMGRNDTFRLLCAACASGEEAYTLSMILSRYIRADGTALRYEILAADINTDMLSEARRGVYPRRAAEAIPKEYHHCLSWQLASVTMHDAVRLPITFQQHNLLHAMPIPRADVVFCRNLMIYFAPPERQRLLNTLCAALKPGGTLFIGATETLRALEHTLESVAPSVYRKGRDEP